MRGIGQALSRLNAAPARSMRAMIAGAALLAGATSPHAQAQAQIAANNGDETAMGIPRVSSRGGGAALPQPLSAADAARIRKIFALQSRGDIPAAIAETGMLTDATLLGPILADRYLGRFRRTPAADLADWLRTYPDQPDARPIHALLAKQDPKAEPPAFCETLDPVSLPDAVPEDLDPPGKAVQRSPGLDRAVGEHLRTGNFSAATHLVSGVRGVSAEYAALLRGELAQGLFAQGRDEEALEIAASAARRGEVALPAYVAGLAAWRLDRIELARNYFDAAADAQVASPAVQAAAAYWAGRARLRLHDEAGSRDMMKLAAAQPRTFYGLLARRSLNLSNGFGFGREVLGIADVEAIAAFPAGMRAFALLQVGQPARAEAQLRTIWPATKDAPGLGHSLLLVATQAGLVDFAAQLAALEQEADGRPRDNARFPVPRLAPRGGFSVDPALVYALARLESNFDSAAISAVGARGLMQLMPVTANYLAHDPAFGEASATLLHDPGVNLELGQRYVRFLAEQDGINGNLLYMLASYNAGPYAVAKWPATTHHNGDPLLFIEAIPSLHTRIFVQHALAFTWIYAARLNLPAPSLDELASGEFPRFVPTAAGRASPAPRIH